MKDEIPAYQDEWCTGWNLEDSDANHFNVTVHQNKCRNHWVIQSMTYIEEIGDWGYEETYSGPDFSRVLEVMRQCGVKRLIQGAL